MPFIHTSLCCNINVVSFVVIYIIMRNNNRYLLKMRERLHNFLWKHTIKYNFFHASCVCVSLNIKKYTCKTNFRIFNQKYLYVYLVYDDKKKIKRIQCQYHIIEMRKNLIIPLKKIFFFKKCSNTHTYILS